MGNKIIIDSGVLAKISELIGDLDTSLEREGAMQVQQLILENSTTISIDESIEERAIFAMYEDKLIDLHEAIEAYGLEGAKKIYRNMILDVKLGYKNKLIEEIKFHYAGSKEDSYPYSVLTIIEQF